MRAVVALGGNALSPPGTSGSADELRAALTAACAALAEVVAGGWSLVLIHGNGPQVGRILIQQQAAVARVPAMPLDVCGAQSAGQLGYLLAEAMDNALAARGQDGGTLCLVTRVVVDPTDPAFARPTKPVGPTYDEAEAKRLSARAGQTWAAGSDGRWRRVVASPPPLGIVEAEGLRALVAGRRVVIAGGGGGVPVAVVDGRLQGVEAVVDKDLTAALLGELVDAELLLLLSDVSALQRGFGTPEAAPVPRLAVPEARASVAAGEFPAGSMAPKVQAAADFVGTRRDRRAVITDLRSIAGAIDGRLGTQVVAE